jgi:hypothetical protein
MKAKTLDLILTNIPERVAEVTKEGRLEKSDYVVIATRVAVGWTEEEEKQPSPDLRWWRWLRRTLRWHLLRK